MKLVIAEKPSVAQSLAAVIGATTRKDGYLEGNGWRVSWCLGHLAGLADADTYNPDYAKWRYDDLPILPEHWRFTITKGKWEQFDVLRTLLRQEDVTEVINACDAGREGELIFRTVYCMAGCTKPMKRLWISSMEDSAIREGFANLRPGTDYDGLHQAALCRAKADWLVGINATRLFSVLYHRTLNIGRVMSPTLALIVQREAEISTFKPVPFYTVVLDLPGFSVSGERMADKAAAQQLKTACQGAAAMVKKVERTDKSEKPPALYDLTTLQRDANRLLGFTAQQTLDYLQNLYEKKLCTYPRTDSRYLTSDMAASLPELVRLTAGALPFAADMELTCNAAQVINDKKVTDHHAVIPTRNLQGADLTGLPVGEKAVLELVALRLLCAVAQPYSFAETAATVECAGAEFTAKGRTVKQPGWRALDAAYRAGLKNAEPATEDKALPELSEGQTLPLSGAAVKEGKTTPPKHFTEDMGILSLERVQILPQDSLSAHGVHQGDLHAGELDVGRHQVNPLRVVQDTLARAQRLVHQNTAHSVGQGKGQLVRLGVAQADGQAALRVPVDQQHFLPGLCQPDSQVGTGRCFANAAFLIGDGDDLRVQKKTSSQRNKLFSKLESSYVWA